MTYKEKLLKRLPKHYHEMIYDFVPADGLVDECKYLIYFNLGVSFCGYKDPGSWPVKTMNEAIQTIKECCEYE